MNPQSLPQSMHGMLLLPFAALLLFSLYRRYRSHVGPQRVRPRRMSLRAALLGVVAVAILAAPIGLPLRLEAAAAMAAGVALAWFSLLRTHFEVRDADRYYTPNLYIGLALTGLLILRIGYRLFLVYPQLQHGGAIPGISGNPFAAIGAQGAPTLLLLGLLAGYYSVYYAGVILRSRRLAVVPAAPPG